MNRRELLWHDVGAMGALAALLKDPFLSTAVDEMRACLAKDDLDGAILVNKAILKECQQKLAIYEGLGDDALPE